MTKSYLLVFSDKTGTKDELKLALNKMTKVKTWRTDMPNCFYVISDNSAQELYEEFTSIRGTSGRFLFAETSSNRQGLLPSDTWYLLKNKKLKPKET